MKHKKRQNIITIASMFAAGFVHSILPQWNFWIRTATTGAVAVVVFLLLLALIPQPIER